MEKEIKEVDLYDFDQTIVPFDSGTFFVFHCLVHYPWIILFAPVILIAAILMITHIISFTSFKKICYIFVPFVPLEKAVKKFWDKHEKDVYPWFHNRERYTIVISASPDFLLREIQSRLGFEKLICTRHNRKTGTIIGKNCRDDEKVKRLYKEYGRDEIRVIDVYSDSLRHDKHIFSLAQGNCYNIVRGKRIQFNYKDKYKNG